MKLSVRNIFKDKVVRIVKGAVNSGMSPELPGGAQIVSIITNISVKSLKLKKGVEVHAVVRASNVMIAAD